ncbi:MAG: hypothetical protein QKB75_gp5 [Bacilladnaviridae sp.]|uniref:Capsid protein n=1 Tax=Bacilladnaviridae sp. isolate ctia23 TaxID=3070178 RepID=A0A345N327_9VIRU|nr:MAG: hypothetical protein QKB75_gp5 [Bacilladnaviridae sp.]AXH78027.1 MAG: hypothetical protein [Bacilladnaviridae sp. isolate ctia23]
MARRKATPQRRAPRRAARRPVKRRATAKKQPASSVKKQASGGTAAAHHQVRMHPFSKATQQPKIPDGELTTSLSRRLQAVYQLTNGNGNLGDDYMDVVFAPTLGVPLVASGSTEGVSVRNASANQASYHGFTGQTVGFTLQNTSGSVPQVIPSTGPLTRKYEFHNECGFAKWRIVSQGVRFDLTNTDEENDGWWEACRFNWRRLNSDLCITPLDGSKTDTILGVAPSHQVAMHLRTISLPEQSGYETGLIKDIKKHEFMLHPQSGTHDPVELDLQYNIEEVTGFNVDVNAQQLTLVDGSADSGRIKDTTVDSNLDWMYIRFHPRTNTGAGSANGSSLLTSMIQNIEVAFNPSSDFATFQTINKLDARAKKVTDEINNVSRASKKRGK